MTDLLIYVMLWVDAIKHLDGSIKYILKLNIHIKTHRERGNL